MGIPASWLTSTSSIEVYILWQSILPISGTVEVGVSQCSSGGMVTNVAGTQGIYIGNGIYLVPAKIAECICYGVYRIERKTFY